MPGIEIEPNYDQRSHYMLNATGSQAVKTALHGFFLRKKEESIIFYSTWLFLAEKDLHLIKYKDFVKIALLTKQKLDYKVYQSIINVLEPSIHPKWEQTGYIAVLGRKKKTHELMGFLIFVVDDTYESYVMGIWPIHNHIRYEQVDKSELQSLFQREIKDFTKPKLWSLVYLFLQPPKLI